MGWRDRVGRTLRLCEALRVTDCFAAGTEDSVMVCSGIIAETV